MASRDLVCNATVPHPIMVETPQPLEQHSKAARITFTLPTHSKEKSTPPWVISRITSAMGALSVGTTVSVAPNSFAVAKIVDEAITRHNVAARSKPMQETSRQPLANFLESRSMPIILLAPACRAASITARPTVPKLHNYIIIIIHKQ
eukprot:GHVQ01008619.1.p1 GENE.GHVQ01008619.1~~GHVQ01008619.1.p1  ORF type:complete len:148 (+),score=3.31 GHVQ01008619.1:827-1270(+)